MSAHNPDWRRTIVAALCLGLLVLTFGVMTASAATTVTPNNPDGWGPTDVRADATVAITTAQPRSGDGSLQFQTITVTPGQDKADFTKTWSDPTRTLAAVTKVAFEYYRDSSSTTGVHQLPAVRLLFWQDNAPAGLGPEDHTGYLIWEGIYNGINPAPTNSWEAEDLTSQFFWMRLVTGPNTTGGCGKTIQNFSVTLADWETSNPQGQPGDCVAPDIDGTTYISGINTGVGSGWGANFLGYVDNVELFFGADEVSANFEPNPQCTTVCYADAVGGNDANGGTSPADAKKTIQAAIDAVSAGGQVRVLPGSYDETATGRDVLGVGSYQFGLFFEETAKDGVSLMGVTAADVEITDPTLTEADITTNATNNFGASGIFVEADDVTISGLEIGPNTPGENKTIEVIGNNFTLKNSFISGDGVDGGYPYINDWRYDDVNDIAYLTEYTIDNNVFGSGSQIAISSGAGGSGPVGGRQITNNEFTMGTGQNWPSISFNGAGGVAWFTYPVGGAIITGNSFNNVNYGAEQWIRARGDYIEAQFDWASYWNDNTYDNATVAGATVPDAPRPYSYSTFTNVRRIGAKIQLEVDTVALAGDTVLVASGTYPEQVTIAKTLELLGSGAATTFIAAPATIPVASNPNSVIVKVAGAAVSAEIHEFTITGPGPSGCGSILAGIFVRDGAYANIHDNTVTDVRDTGDSGCQNGHAILVGRTSLSSVGTADIKDNLIDNYQKTGIVVSYTGSSANIEDNDVLGDGPKTTIAENGIQVSGGATAEIKGNTISGHSYSPFTAVSVGVLLFGPATINTDDNTITENQVGIYVIDADGTHKNNTISATSAGTGSPGFWGIVVDAPPPTHVPSPFEVDEAAMMSAQSVTANSPAANQIVTITGNNMTSDGSTGGVGLEADAGFGSFDIDVTATKNIIHNWEYGVYVFECSTGCTGTDFANVDINRNSIVGNTTYGMFADTLTPVTDGTCNWWGDASGPSDQGPGTGDKVGVDIDFVPWLYTDDLDGPCFVGGTITVVKQAGDVGDQFEFNPSWSLTNFFLYSGGSLTSDPLQPGIYSVSEVNLPSGWSLDNASCVNEGGPLSPMTPVGPSNIPVEDYDAWVCTFTNVYAPPPANICPAEYESNLWTDIIGKGMGNTNKHKTSLKLNLPNYLSIDTLYGQLVAKDLGNANYVRFILPGKNNYVQVNAITSPSERTYGNFWYGAYVNPAKSVSGRWFLQKSGVKNHIPRAFVLYPTYEDADDTYVNVWDTFDASEGEVYWDTANGWTQERVITMPIAPPNGSTTFHVELAVVDNDKDSRPVWVTVEAGGVSQTQMPVAPSAGDELNLMTFSLANVPAGTDEITITMYSPSAALNGVAGDSATLVGMAANYVCAPLED